MNIQEGILSARSRARKDRPLYTQGVRSFGKLITSYLGNFPNGMAIGHLLQVNPELKTAPEPSSDRRRGFMYAPFQESRNANVAWEALDQPINASYVWGRDVNRIATKLYTANSSLFLSPGEDFWRTVYLQHILGDIAFQLLWIMRDTTQPTVYDSLLYAVNTNTKSFPGWPIYRLKQTVFIDCQYVFEIAKFEGSLVTSGYGIQPVLSKDAMLQIYK